MTRPIPSFDRTMMQCFLMSIYQRRPLTSDQHRALAKLHSQYNLFATVRVLCIVRLCVFACHQALFLVVLKAGHGIRIINKNNMHNDFRTFRRDVRKTELLHYSAKRQRINDDNKVFCYVLFLQLQRIGHYINVKAKNCTQ